MRCASRRQSTTPSISTHGRFARARRAQSRRRRSWWPGWCRRSGRQSSTTPRKCSAARAAGADAIHPGYGFLSENASFAEACAAAAIVYIGPDPSAMRTLGDKAAARQMAAGMGIPIVQGYDGVDQSFDALAAAATAIGFPLLIKPAAGGGGKGMRVVPRLADLRAARE